MIPLDGICRHHLQTQAMSFLCAKEKRTLHRSGCHDGSSLLSQQCGSMQDRFI
jgi:hypothetical protein